VFGILTAFVWHGAGIAANDSQTPSPDVIVLETGGVYHVTAQFDVPQEAAIALAVLTDYDAIPRFMPDIKTSIVRQRAADSVLVEQEVVARMMMFSKRIHLLLQVQMSDRCIRFRDSSGQSFVQYEGIWQLAAAPGGTTVSYVLTARPTFDVPQFVLKRLLKRDSQKMIEQLRREMAARAR
jgi:ribosome-associated toxin RatA of RatAB toxin-antitoxin module